MVGGPIVGFLQKDANGEPLIEMMVNQFIFIGHTKEPLNLSLEL